MNRQSSSGKAPAIRSFDPWIRRSLVVVPAIALLLVARYTQAQSQPPSNAPTTTVSVNVKVVNVYATVRDKKGRIIQNLTKDDFLVQEDGRPQTVKYFAKQSDLPLTLGLLVDTSPSEARMLNTEREASRTFFDKVLRVDKDKAFLIHFDREVELLQDITPSRNKLVTALDDLNTSPSDQRRRDDDDQRQGGGQRQGRGFHGATTTLFDAVYLACNDVLKPVGERKALVVIGDGDDNGSKVSRSEAITAAQKSNTIIYAVRIYDKDFGNDDRSGMGNGGGGGHHGGFGIPGIGGPGMGGPMGTPGRGGQGGGGQGGPNGPSIDKSQWKKNLEALADQTGGRVFEVSKKEPLENIYSQIEEDLRNQYSLGYTPDANGKSGYRTIKLAVKDKSMTVRARDGYYADEQVQASK